MERYTLVTNIHVFPVAIAAALHLQPLQAVDPGDILVHGLLNAPIYIKHMHTSTISKLSVYLLYSSTLMDNNLRTRRLQSYPQPVTSSYSSPSSVFKKHTLSPIIGVLRPLSQRRSETRIRT